MVNHAEDPDVVRWGLHLLDVCSLSSSGCCSTVTQYGSNSYPFDYIREVYCEDCVADVSIENDAVIAHALQEEFSRVASVEASGICYAENEEIKESILAQDWLPASKRHFTSVAELNKGREGNEIRCTCSSPQMISPNEDSCPYCLQISDEATLDGEVGKRLDKMISVPHVPKINGSVPSDDEETSDHQRLLDRLQVYDLVEFKVEGDGNCQFRALSDQIYRTPEQYKYVRRQVVNQLRYHSELYEGYVPMAYKDYLNKMSRNGEWGDHVTLQAVADSYGIKIFVITSFKETCYIEIIPQVQNSRRVIFLSFWAEVHYNSIYPAGDVPMLEHKRKKKYWLF